MADLPPRLLRSAAGLLLLAWLPACGWLWPTDAPYDPLRCPAPCEVGVCHNGTCVPSGPDAGPDAASDMAASDATPDRGPAPDYWAVAQGCMHPPVIKDCAQKDPTLGASWCHVPNGCFKMGFPATAPCSDGGSVREHPVTLTHGFVMMRTEVTQAQYRQVMGPHGPGDAGAPDSATYSCTAHPCPASKVSWHQAAAFCNALSLREGLTPCYSCVVPGADAGFFRDAGVPPTVTCVDLTAASGYGNNKAYACPGYRLPSEAEYEYAYRAGSDTQYYKVPGKCDGKMAAAGCKGSDPNAGVIGWYKANNDVQPATVATREANAWGLSDLAGNIFEWCHDPADDVNPVKAKLHVTDPVGQAVSSYLKGQGVLRGGDYTEQAWALRAASRTFRTRTLQANTGFRCVRSLKP